MIPYHIRNRKPKNFKQAYKKYRFNIKNNPKIVKNPYSNKYDLIWPGE